jgi:hypothetical protein
MGTWWRSEEMTYVSLIISEEVNPAPVTSHGSPNRDRASVLTA